MAHYLVGVIVNDISNADEVAEEIDNILAPYDSNMRVEPYIKKTKTELIADGKARKEKYSHEEDIQDWMKPYLEATTDEELYKLEIEHEVVYGIDKNGNLLSVYNPKSKWDGYCICRWINESNVIQIRDFILYEDLDEDTVALYKKAWDSFEGKCELSKEEEKTLFGNFRLYNDKYYLDRYGTCENYIKDMSSNIPFAFVDVNGWREMGWFGCDGVTQESIKNYIELAENYFRAEENQNKYIVWVDCHV